MPRSTEPRPRKGARRGAGVLGLTTAASVLLHGGLAVALGAVALGAWPWRGDAAARGTALREGRRHQVDMQSEVTVELERPDPPLPRTGGTPVARLDEERRGRGGEATSRERAVNLATRDESLRLSPDPMTQLHGDQVQRLRVAKDRASDEDLRVTPEPMDLTLVISGKGKRLERRPVSQWDPSRGARHAGAETRLGEAPVTELTVLLTATGEDATLGKDLPMPSALPALGRTGTRAVREAPGTGLTHRRRGADHRASAAVGRARPAVEKGAVATLANRGDGRVRDDLDADQEVASTVRALVHASVAGGLPGDGRGGMAGAGPVGAGGTAGAGSVSVPLGPGEGDYVDLGTSDPRLARYFRGLRARIEPLWRDAFPRSALLELKQGTVILEFVVAANGQVRVQWPPLRPSGVPEFDANCAEAVRRAGPFEPIPKEIGRSQLRIRAPFVARNPIVR